MLLWFLLFLRNFHTLDITSLNTVIVTLLVSKCLIRSILWEKGLILAYCWRRHVLSWWVRCGGRNRRPAGHLPEQSENQESAERGP